MGAEQSRPHPGHLRRVPPAHYTKGMASTVDSMSSSLSMCFGPRKRSMKEAWAEWVDVNEDDGDITMKDLSVLSAKFKVLSRKLLLATKAELQTLKGRVVAAADAHASSVCAWSSVDLAATPTGVEEADTVDKASLGWHGRCSGPSGLRQAARREVRKLLRKADGEDRGECRRRVRRIVRDIRRGERVQRFLRKQRLQEQGRRTKGGACRVRKTSGGKFLHHSKGTKAEMRGVIEALQQQVRGLCHFLAAVEAGRAGVQGVEEAAAQRAPCRAAAPEGCVCRLACKSGEHSPATRSECSFSIDETRESLEEGGGNDVDEGYMPLCKAYGRRRMHWRQGRLLGKGAYGAVYVILVEDGSQIAIKRVDLRPQVPGGTSEASRLAFEGESSLLQRLQHPNVVDFLASKVVSPDTALIWMEYVAGGSVSCMLKMFGPMREGTVGRFAGHVLSGLAYLHSERVVHRDVKPHNLLVTTRGVVKLGDFGAAAYVRDEQGMTKGIAGTANYMAPEMLRCSNNKKGCYSFNVDVWSLGVSAVEMLTAETPFGEHSNVFAVMFRIAREGPPPMPENISDEARAFLAACLDRDFANRAAAAKMLAHPFVARHAPRTATPPALHSAATQTPTKAAPAQAQQPAVAQASVQTEDARPVPPLPPAQPEVAKLSSACTSTADAPCGPGGVFRRSSRSMAHAAQSRSRKSSSSSNGRAPSASGRSAGRFQHHAVIERVLEEIRSRRQDFE
mmetsp:Transcript_50433/g.122979  ORF Transcript_50433/g.122979 Transcript_50433/m.122979 type:complete len:734 (+) Transcript_50433:192-2393(+)